MIDLIIITSISIINIVGIIFMRYLIKKEPECVSKCCNVNIIDNNNP